MSGILTANPMPILFEQYDSLVRFARLRAKRDFFDGRETPRAGRYMRMCSHLYAIAGAVNVFEGSMTQIGRAVL